MNELLILMLAALAIGLAGFFLSPARHALQAWNLAEGVHEDSITKKADGAITTRHLLMKQGSDADHAAACGASDFPIGVCNDEAAAAEDLINIQSLNANNETRLMVASEAITVDEPVYAAASGKIQDEPAVAGTYFRVGVAKTAASADGDQIEVETHAPIRVVVLATETQDTLTDNLSGTADTTIADITAAATITDNSGGTDPGDDTIAAVTNTDALTDSTGGTADDTVSDASTAVGETQNAGSADKTDVDARLVTINNNFKEVVDQLATQRTANTALLAAIAQLAAKQNTTSTAVGVIEADLKDIVAQLAKIKADIAGLGATAAAEIKRL